MLPKGQAGTGSPPYVRGADISRYTGALGSGQWYASTKCLKCAYLPSVGCGRFRAGRDRVRCVSDRGRVQVSTKKTEKELPAVKPVADPFIQEVERIVLAKDSEPFHILGPHWIERDGARSLAIRAFRPGAISASIIWGPSKTVHAARQIHTDGFFEAELRPEAVRTGNATSADVISPDAYRLRFRFADGSEIETY